MGRKIIFSLLLVSLTAGIVPASPDHEEMLRKSCAKLLPGAAICFTWWCVELNVELAGMLMIDGKTTSIPAVTQLSGNTGSDAGSSTIIESNISSLIQDGDFSDKKKHNTDFRSRPRPRPRMQR